MIEIIPPHDINQSPLATERFLATLHALVKQRSLTERFFGKKKFLSLEIVSSKEKGIRFIVRVQKDNVAIIKKHLISFLPGVRIAVVDDYLQGHEQMHRGTVTLKQAKHFNHALQDQPHLTQHDPLAYITGQMTKLNQDELISVQYILTHATQRSIQPEKLILHLIAFILLTPITFISWLLSHNSKSEALPLWLIAPEKQDKKDKDEKIQKELFTTTIRLSVSLRDHAHTLSRIQGLVSAYASFRNTNEKS